ncbi:hypothetical protein Bb109J_c1232 [Bdellovibrio bacteriovorus]|uniref:hypothetical protein n=1 Tax=Bdellovibrio bacteriovorus TaxID=959 RepID=UPI00045BFF48|nr:hypothetical protein [Bdellovibrio bacteriovorus]AHZ86567.1 hypothetical protein EP01_16730 [Bdellovibrio bacteriovorus]BEV67812.1 hypothetical protein Bb109J_c1232 [Bdellovibrio bacteriovorus]
MKKAILMILAGAMMAQSVQAGTQHANTPRNIASQEQLSPEAHAAVKAIKNQTLTLLQSGKSEISPEDLQALSEATAGLTPEQRLEVLQAALVQLQRLSHYISLETQNGNESTIGGALVINTVISGCLTAIMFVNDDASKPSMLRWIGVVVTAASVGGLVTLMVKGNPERDRLENMTKELTNALMQASRSTMLQIEAEALN